MTVQTTTRSVSDTADALRRPATGVEIAVIALWFGLLTAAGEVALLLVKRHVRGQMIDVGPDFVWLLSLADLTLFSAAALMVAGAARLAGKRVTAPAVVLVLCWLSALSLLLHYRPIGMYARLLLAAGTATFVARLAGQHWSTCVRTARYTSPILAVLIALTAAWHVRGGTAGARGAEMRSTGHAGLSNVLLIILDTVAARHLSLYGYTRQTSPHLDALAPRATVFTQAFATAPWTVPSHATMFTGRYPFELTADWQTPLDTTQRTLAETFSDRGYATALVGANRFLGPEYGLDRGFAHVSVHRVAFSEAVRVTSLGTWLNGRGNWIRRLFRYYRPLARRSAADVNAHFINWIAQRDGRPFFAVLNYMDAHAPYTAPAPFDTKFEIGAPRTNPMMAPEWTPEAIEAERAAYDEAIAYLDDRVGELIYELDRSGVLDSTIVVITADHGEQFGGHGHMEHSPSLYLSSLWVPLLVVAPHGVPRGVRVDAPATLRDLPATILDLAGVQDEDYPGRSLARFWTGTGNATEIIAAHVSQGIRTPPSYPISRGDMTSLIRGQYQFILNGDGVEELYDYVADPGELRNLASDARFAWLLDEFRRSLGRFAVPAASREEGTTTASQ